MRRALPNVAAAALAVALTAGCDDAPGPPPAAGSPSVTAASIAFFENRLTERPSSFVTANALAARYLRRFGEVGRYDHVSRAEEVVRRGLRAVPTASGHARLAAVLAVRHRFVEAEEHARVALTLDSANAGVNAVAFDVLSERGAYSEALRALERLDPRGFPYLVRRARWRKTRGDFRGAERDLQRACRGVEAASTDPTALAWCLTQQAEVALALGRDRDAGQTLRKAFAIAPEYPSALAVLAWMSYRDGALARARGLYERVLASGREDEHDVHLVLAQINRALGDAAGGRAHEAAFERLATAPGMEVLYGHHLTTYLAEQPGAAAAALPLARAEIARRPAPESYEGLGWVLYHLGRIDDALDAARQSVATGNGDATLFYRAGLIHLAAGEAPEGRQLLAHALERRFELDPNDERDTRSRLKSHVLRD